MHSDGPESGPGVSIVTTQPCHFSLMSQPVALS